MAIVTIDQDLALARGLVTKHAIKRSRRADVTDGQPFSYDAALTSSLVSRLLPPHLGAQKAWREITASATWVVR
jgi:hypothetical protein